MTLRNSLCYDHTESRGKAGVSIRTLQYYDKIGLLKPARYTESGYRLYDDTGLERLQQILLFRELEFPLKEIKEIITGSNFDKVKALDQQIELLTLKKEHLENLIDFARKLKTKGADIMDFSAYDTSKIDEYAKKAKEEWGDTPQYKEYEKKSASRSKEDEANMMKGLLNVFAEFGKIKDTDPSSDEAKALARKLQDYITEHFYNCTNDILLGLGQVYVSNREFTENIDKAGGKGTADFACRAIKAYCGK